MRVFIICVVFVLSVTTDIVSGKYHRIEHGWLSKHRVMATWDEAHDYCQHEGAVLASPISVELMNGMKSKIVSNSLFFTGIRATISKLSFQSIEGYLSCYDPGNTMSEKEQYFFTPCGTRHKGVVLDDMPISDMFEQLNPDEGQCLAMSSVGIQVVPCTSRLPYMCYKKKTNIITVVGDECATNGYKYTNLTNSCYKFHSEHTSWTDAFTSCVSEGGYLAVVKNPNEPSVVLKDALAGVPYYTWIGFLKYNATDNWKSIKEPPYNSLSPDWVKNNFDVNAAICRLVNPNNGVLAPNKIVSCSDKQPFLCEKDPWIEKEMLQVYDFTSTKMRN